MKMMLTETMFIDLFMNYRKDQFSTSALRAIFEYLEEYDKDWEFDPAAICCNFCEYDSARDAAASYYDWEPDADDDDENEESAFEYLIDRTSVLTTDVGSIVIHT